MNKLLGKIFLSFSLLLPELAKAHDQLKKTRLDTMLKTADAVVVAKVVDVQYAISRGDERALESLPHTLVTFEVQRILKGNPQQERITLRFLGGRGHEAEFLMVHNAPLFDLGDEDILFIKGNQKLACPLAGCAQGRMRSINGFSYSDVGQQIVLTPRKQLASGRFDQLEDVLTHKVSQTVMKKQIANERGEGKPEPELSVGVHLRFQALIELIAERVRLLNPNNSWQRLPPVKSADLQTPFTVKLPQPTKAKKIREVPVRRPRPTPAEALEEALYNRNEGNPVLGQ